MSTPAWREGAAIAAMGAAAALGAEMALLDPVRRATERDATEARRLGEDVQRLESLSGDVALLTATLREASTEAARIERVGAAARDPGRVFENLHNLAGEHGLVMDRLDPVIASRDAARVGDPRDRTIRYSITVRGTFAGVVRMIGRLPEGLGFTRVAGVRVHPAGEDGRDEVVAALETEHWAFDATTPPEVAGTGGTP
ncbi:MAG: hypothetical protein ACKVU4_11620 [Phycisphaerales bacterium]